LREVVAEQRKRLDERAAPQRHLSASIRGGIERRETLKHADGIVRGEHGNGGAEPDAVAAPGDGRKHDLRRRHGEIGPVVLADAEDIDAEGVGVDAFLDHVADDFRLRQRTAVGLMGNVAEGIEAELKLCHGPTE
jgi:hypothetical protein